MIVGIKGWVEKFVRIVHEGMLIEYGDIVSE